MKLATDCKLWIVMSLFAAVALTACGKAPDGRPAETNQAAGPSPGFQHGDEAPAPDPAPEPPPAEPAPPVTSAAGPAAWSALPGTQAWTDATLQVVRANFAKFDAARDREDFCPGYVSASRAQRETCWVRLVSAVVKYECNFKPTAMYKESSGVYSVGLLMLSRNECKNAPTNEALKNPVLNLLCGSQKMADLIARYGYVTTPDNKHGAAAYWSTLRRPYVQSGLHLGKRNEITAIARQFLVVTPVE